jgi:hypothetical protein
MSFTITAKQEFKVGDRVYVNYGHGWNGSGTVVEVWSSGNISVKTDSGKHGSFNLEYLTLIEPAPIVHIKSKVFSIAKSIAVTLAKQSSLRITNIDRVQSELFLLGYNSADLGNAAGCVFRGKNWKKFNKAQSNRKGNHSREIVTWEYVGR